MIPKVEGLVGIQRTNALRYGDTYVYNPFRKVRVKYRNKKGKLEVGEYVSPGYEPSMGFTVDPRLGEGLWSPTQGPNVHKPIEDLDSKDYRREVEFTYEHHPLDFVPDPHQAMFDRRLHDRFVEPQEPGEYGPPTHPIREIKRKYQTRTPFELFDQPHVLEGYEEECTRDPEAEGIRRRSPRIRWLRKYWFVWSGGKWVHQKYPPGHKKFGYRVQVLVDRELLEFTETTCECKGTIKPAKRRCSPVSSINDWLALNMRNLHEIREEFNPEAPSPNEGGIPPIYSQWVECTQEMIDDVTGFWGSKGFEFRELDLGFMVQVHQSTYEARDASRPVDTSPQAEMEAVPEERVERLELDASGLYDIAPGTKLALSAGAPTSTD